MGTPRTRREFLGNVGQGMLVASVSLGTASDLGLTTVRADDDGDGERLVFGGLEPPPREEGTTVALVARGFGLWSLFACRIVRAIEEHGPVELSGFAYGTLPGHALSGEERFTITWDRAEGSVWYDLLAISRPSSLAWRLVHPLVRRAQRRFAPASLQAMADALASGER